MLERIMLPLLIVYALFIACMLGIPSDANQWMRDAWKRRIAAPCPNEDDQ